MIKQVLTSLIALLFISTGIAQDLELNFYLPQDITYNKNIPKPKEVIGHEVGEWHVSHDRLVNYMYAVAKASDRVTIEEIGQTHEGRPLLVLTITSPENHDKLEEIRQTHLKLSDPNENIETKNIPAVVYMGYSIHGNEPSGSNASLLAAYYLAAAQGNAIDEILTNTIILLDPSLNPDGLNRFANWVNTNKSKTRVTDANTRELREPWPGGRTNHYWFDLNRDWLPLQQPESQARMAIFQRWKPNILTDHHEMGSNSTFFFQPGIPSRNNPLTPANTFVLTEKIAQFHAEALDAIGSLYYSKESFDDFYYGKGSTYPDVNGGIGILFEQASSRGHARNTSNGILTFPFAIRNQFTTTLSTLKAANALRTDLLNHQKEFYQSAVKLAANDNIKAYVFEDVDQTKLQAFTKILLQHKIEVYHLSNSVNGISSKGLIVPTGQPQYLLIKAIFEQRTTFQDSIFYDVSAWTLPLAFNLKYAEVKGKSFSRSLLSDAYIDQQKNGFLVGGQASYAYAFSWDNYNAPKLLYGLQAQGILCKVATHSFSSTTGKQFNAGAIIISVQNQKIGASQLYQTINKLTNDYGIAVHSLGSGNTDGVNLGSPTMKPLKKPSVAIITGNGISSYEAGEVWHLLDIRVGMPVSLIDMETFNNRDLSNYSSLVLVEGSYNPLDKKKLMDWLSGGGNIIATRSATKWLADNGISNATFKKGKQDTLDNQRFPYDDYSKIKGTQSIGGAIFMAKADLSNPICYGYPNENIPVFRNNTLFMEYSKSPYANPVIYQPSPLLSGYISNKNKELMEGTAVINISAFGKGKVISFVDNPNFRAFWYGTNRLFINSLFFGSIINGSTLK